MSLGEFALIDRFFSRPLPARDDVLVGIGDDGALLRLGAGRRLVTSVAVVGAAASAAAGHDAARLGNDVMATALNRLAAAGAQPAWATLALTLPEADEHWLAAFSDALFAVAEPCAVALVGGDTTHGPFAATVVGHGLVDSHVETSIGVGDGIYVSGRLATVDTGERPLPSTIRVALGGWVRAHGGIAADLSEGLADALVQLLGGGAFGARVALADLPLAATLRHRLHTPDDWSMLARARGDMELCCIVPAAAHADLQAWAGEAQSTVTRVATVDDSRTIVFLDGDGRPLASADDAEQDAPA